MNDMTYSTARAVGSLSVLAVLSPLAGMAVEIALAWRFGTSPAVDAFRIGMVFLLMGQQLLVLQILPHIVVPVFTDYEAQAGKREAWRVVLSLGNVFLSVVVAFAVLVGNHEDWTVRAPQLARKLLEAQADSAFIASR